MESRKVVDVNILAIFLVENHPGHKFVSEALVSGLKGDYTPVILNIIPIRVFWIMSRQWGLDKARSMESIMDFIKKYEQPEYVGLEKATLIRSFKLSKQLRHDVYDCVYLSLAIQERAGAILTTDTDFAKLCSQINIRYENPVPVDVLRKFGPAIDQHK